MLYTQLALFCLPHVRDTRTIHTHVMYDMYTMYERITHHTKQTETTRKRKGTMCANQRVQIEYG